MRISRLAAAALALTFLGGAASAQLKQEAPKETPAAAVKKEAKKAAPSPCAGLEEAVCKANTACTWYRETTTKKGQKRKAHCQKKPTPRAKKK
jgi:hypothetical protein